MSYVMVNPSPTMVAPLAYWAASSTKPSSRSRILLVFMVRRWRLLPPSRDMVASSLRPSMELRSKKRTTPFRLSRMSQSYVILLP